MASRYITTLSKQKPFKQIFLKPLYQFCSFANEQTPTHDSQPDPHKTDDYKKIESLCKDRRFDDAKHLVLSLSEKGIDYNEDLFILLINGYAKSTKKWDIVKNCVKILLKMEELGVSKTVKFYNVLLEVVISEKKWNMAEKYFEKMLDEGIVPDMDTYRVMITGLCRCLRVETARKLFEDMKSRNFSPDFVVYNAMIKGYVGVKRMDEAEKIFMEMKGLGMEPDLVSYNLMINGYVQVRKMEDVERLVVEMKGRDIELDLVAYNTMVNGYVLVGKMEDAEKVVVEMKERRIEPDLVTYVTMIKGYVKADRVDDGLKLLEEMKGKRFGRNVDVRSCLGRLKEDCDGENMSESQQSVLQGVEVYVERLELLALRDAARELSELASRRVVGNENSQTDI
ncbi:pentatricopeptide repeat protein [Artemisia annua]|uniref:Pentatricopeptide repeat protein n=1 Tax=Artemisia annua TaxID=35608 RepID=A0A2U1KZ00_ARTAN|nr:pentatricopeptide repeat protein [Artemisia annua]